MKIRKGFVSNSSSSSFVCSVCNESEEGWDLCLSEIDYWECVNGHVICGACLVSDLPKAEDDDTDNYDMPEDHCPICSFIEPDHKLVGQYLKNKYGITRDEVFAEIKAKNKRRKKLYDNEYVAYILAKYNIQQQDLLDEFKNRFGSFDEFSKFVNLQ